MRGLARFDGRAAFSTWAYRVATNACLDELRRRRRRPAVRPRPDVASAAGAAPGADLERPVADRLDLDAALAAAAAGVPGAVVLRDLCGLDYAEIAEVLDIPPGTVRSRIARGRAQLADARSASPGNQPSRLGTSDTMTDTEDHP